MLVRPATTRDARAIATIQVRGWQIGYRGIVANEYLARFSVEGMTNRWLANLAEPVRMEHLVAEDDEGSVVGWAAFGVNQTDPASAIGELGALYVDPGRWNAGTGGMLLAAAEEGLATAGYGRAVLWTLAGNLRTRRFYENRGWRFDGTSETHGSGAEVVRYVKELGLSVDPGAAPEYDSNDEQT